MKHLSHYKIIVTFSGGKDSQACLIWACNEYGAKNITAVFCDTGWESPKTYEHISYVVDKLGVELVVLKSKKYDGMADLVEKKKRFPSTKARFCTEELKSKPMNDYVLDNVQNNILVIQGIRKDESQSRSKMNKLCKYFKYYFEPYTDNKMKLESVESQILKASNENKPFAELVKKQQVLQKKIEAGKIEPKYHKYRKKDVKEFCAQYVDMVLRPVFDWSGQEVIDYIRANGYEPNPLYSEGFSRVGCFPCIMCNQNEIKQISNRYPERIEEISVVEQKVKSTFFANDYIPYRYQTGTFFTDSGGEFKVPTIHDVKRYVTDKNATLDLFQQPTSCMSYYGTCE